MAEEGAGLKGLDDADSPEDESVVEPRGLLRLSLLGGILQQLPRRLQRIVLLPSPTGVVGAGGHFPPSIRHPSPRLRRRAETGQVGVVCV